MVLLIRTGLLMAAVYLCFTYNATNEAVAAGSREQGCVGIGFDHFIVHIDNDPQILEGLKTEIEPLGYPFEPSKGKGTSGFQVANIWIGPQYFEIVRLLNPGGGDWVPEMVEKYNQGKRGLFAIYLLTNKLDQLKKELNQRNVESFGPERREITNPSDLSRITMPWRTLSLPSFPGTDLYIAFLDYDVGAYEKFSPEMIPNSASFGITGIRETHVELPQWNRAIAFLQKVFPELQIKGQKAELSLDGGTLFFEPSSTPSVFVRLKAGTTEKSLSGKRFDLENVEVETVFIKEASDTCNLRPQN